MTRFRPIFFFDCLWLSMNHGKLIGSGSDGLTTAIPQQDGRTPELPSTAIWLYAVKRIYVFPIVRSCRISSPEQDRIRVRPTSEHNEKMFHLVPAPDYFYAVITSHGWTASERHGFQIISSSFFDVLSRHGHSAAAAWLCLIS